MLIKEFCNTEYNGVAGNMDLHNNTVALTINSKSVSKWMGFRQNSFAQFSISQAVLHVVGRNNASMSKCKLVSLQYNVDKEIILYHSYKNLY